MIYNIICIMKKFKTEKDYKYFFENVIPIKLTECQDLKLNSYSWGVITDYFIESVKITRDKPNNVISTAILKIGDASGQVTCLVKGKTLGLLFGLTEEEWSDIENMCDHGQQLFYRYFKSGLSNNFRCEQKIFYDFCLNSQNEDVFIAIFSRTYNTRNKDKCDPFLLISHLIKGNSYFLDLYKNGLRNVNIINKSCLI